MSSRPDNSLAYLTDEGLVVKDVFYIADKMYPIQVRIFEENIWPCLTVLNIYGHFST